MQEAVAGSAVEAVAVGFSPPDALAPLAEHLGWRGRFLADTERRLYRDLGLGRAPWWRVYSPGTIAIYLRAARRGRWGHGSGAPVEDTRQLGGDAVVRGGVAVARWNPRSPDDRVPAGELAAVALDGG
ncbi:AhpC/TSA family protein [Actinomycetospora cinnamomea]|uniref:Alkyl-hydroperoxide reductase/thiol specific antioxidant family protein n=1 Tax=Actinomycetospora cinnamomea TaxID=663609 RepID=A0A2U1FRK9_9PSEU|nr:AhpC/TSA family protein [Actinomycetospora cinnamomea]PVZ14700.1 alkyl-hydroperoxide reductase/thiol specific antioxidant family protein [Actinomycetospora cinnamomea]